MTTRRAAVQALIAWTLAACRRTPRTAVATLDKVPRDSAYRTTVGDQPLIVLNVKGEIRTFLAVCTHEGCPLGWNPNQHLIRCPCHGSAFDTAGQVVNGPAQLPLTRLNTVVDHGAVLVELPAP